MTDNKGKPVKSDERTDTRSAEELRREARHQEGERHVEATDEDSGVDRILQKGMGGYGAQEGTEPARESPPVSDKDERHR